jgi:L-threonylcarbamoyladenylate synthase
VARELAREAGIPIPATSANLSGDPSVSHPNRLEQALLSRLDLLLDGGPLPGGLPSTVLDVTVSPPRLLRPGAISRQSLSSVPGVGPLETI